MAPHTATAGECRAADGDDAGLSAAQRLALLNVWQRGFPLCDEPFAAVGATLGLSGLQVLQAYRQCARDGVLSRIGAVFAPGSGGASTLAAMAVPTDRLEAVAAIVSAHPGVNHNYERENARNLWFVMTGASTVQVEQSIALLEADTGLPVLRLPMLRPYRIDLAFDLAFDRATGPAQGLTPQMRHGMASASVCTTPMLAAEDWPLAALAEQGLPLVKQPYAHWARRLACTPAQVQTTLEQWLHQGVLKRFGVVVRHHELGIAANAMTVLDVPDADVDAAGRALAAQPGVTLAYRRARATGWPYNLYCMVHGAHRSAVLQVLQRALEHSGLAGVPREVLFSRRRFKQTGARRFAAAAPQAQDEGVADAIG